MPLAFINYRRSDSQQAAQALFAQLRARFGPAQSFLDAGAILPGASWPSRLREALGKADVVLSVIGRRWLTAADEYAKRRLDDPEDWVRGELDDALSSLSGWRAIESTVPQDYPKPRHELRKVYRFDSFKSAVGFMSAAVPKINELRHHPRWENQWRSVAVYHLDRGLLESGIQGGNEWNPMQRGQTTPAAQFFYTYRDLEDFNIGAFDDEGSTVWAMFGQPFSRQGN